jgi:hypothetical protein
MNVSIERHQRAIQQNLQKDENIAFNTMLDSAFN